MPDTMCERNVNRNILYSLIIDKFSEIEVTPISRVHFNDTAGFERIKSLCNPVYSSVELFIKQKYTITLNHLILHNISLIMIMKWSYNKYMNYMTTFKHGLQVLCISCSCIAIKIRRICSTYCLHAKIDENWISRLTKRYQYRYNNNYEWKEIMSRLWWKNAKWKFYYRFGKREELGTGTVAMWSTKY